MPLVDRFHSDRSADKNRDRGQYRNSKGVILRHGARYEQPTDDDDKESEEQAKTDQSGFGQKPLWRTVNEDERIVAGRCALREKAAQTDHFNWMGKPGGECLKHDANPLVDTGASILGKIDLLEWRAEIRNL